MCQRLLPHALAATDHATDHAADAEWASSQLDRAATYLEVRGLYREARHRRAAHVSGLPETGDWTGERPHVVSQEVPWRSPASTRQRGGGGACHPPGG
jgi:hypothetical protein